MHYVFGPPLNGDCSVFLSYTKNQYDLIWLVSGAGKVLIPASFLQNTHKPKGICLLKKKQENCLGWNCWRQNSLWNKNCYSDTFCYNSFYGNEISFCTSPLSCCCWLSLILRCTPDSSICISALLGFFFFGTHIRCFDIRTQPAAPSLYLQHFLSFLAIWHFQHCSHLHI